MSPQVNAFFTLLVSDYNMQIVTGAALPEALRRSSGSMAWPFGERAER
jgi:hypothetical protein